MVTKTMLELRNFELFLKLLSKAKGRIVCVDMDNTLADINSGLKKLGYNTKKYPAKLPAGFWNTHVGFKLLQEAQPIPETIAVINLLRDAGAEVVFATARNPELARITEEWLTAHRLEGEVFYVHSKTLVEADVYVEDSPQEIRRILKLGSKVLVPEWPYNRIIHRNIISYRIGRGF